MTNQPEHPREEPEPTGPHSLTDAEALAIAEKLAREVGERPTDSPQDQLLALAHEQAPDDEERVDEALVALDVAEPEDTIRAERVALAHDAEPEAAPTSAERNSPSMEPRDDGPAGDRRS